MRHQTKATQILFIENPSRPEQISKLDQKFNILSYSFRISFKRRETKKVPKHVTVQQVHSAPSSNSLDPSGNALETLYGPMPAKFIRATSVRPKTLSPKFHERFRL